MCLTLVLKFKSLATMAMGVYIAIATGLRGLYTKHNLIASRVVVIMLKQKIVPELCYIAFYR